MMDIQPTVAILASDFLAYFQFFYPLIDLNSRLLETMFLHGNLFLHSTKTLEVSPSMMGRSSVFTSVVISTHSGCPSIHARYSMTVFAAAIRTLSYPLSSTTSFKAFQNDCTASLVTCNCVLAAHLAINNCAHLQSAIRVDHIVAIGI